jgi:DNA-directed RNA polymerase specialized sigma24 family protein
MTRTEFDALYMDQFQALATLLRRSGVEDGHDALQTVYVMVVEDRSYRLMALAQGLEWLRTMMWRVANRQRREARRGMGSRRINEND